MAVYTAYEGDIDALGSPDTTVAPKRNLGPNMVLQNPFAGVSDFGVYTDEYGERQATPTEWLLQNVSPDNPIFQALIGHTSTNLQRVVGQDGNVYYQIAGKTGGPNRERYVQTYREQGNELVPVGEGKFYKGEAPDASFKQFLITAIPMIVSAALPALAPIAAELGISQSVLQPALTASLQITAGVEPQKALGSAVAGYFGTNVTPEVATVVKDYISDPSIANIVAKTAEGAVRGALTGQDIGLSALASATGQTLGGLVQQNISDPETARQLASAVSMGTSAAVSGGNVANAVFAGLTKNQKSNVLENEDPFVASKEEIEQQGRLLTNAILAGTGDLSAFPINIEGQELPSAAPETTVGQSPVDMGAQIPSPSPEKIQITAPSIASTLPTVEQTLLQQIGATAPPVVSGVTPSVEVKSTTPSAAPLPTVESVTQPPITQGQPATVPASIPSVEVAATKDQPTGLLPTLTAADVQVLNEIAAQQGLPPIAATEPVVVTGRKDELLPTQPPGTPPLTTPTTGGPVVVTAPSETPSIDVTARRDELLPTEPVTPAGTVEVTARPEVIPSVEVTAPRDEILPTDTEPVQVTSTPILPETVQVTAGRDDVLPTDDQVISDSGPVVVGSTPISSTDVLPTNEQIILDSILQDQTKEQITEEKEPTKDTTLLPTVLPRSEVVVPPGTRTVDTGGATPTRVALSEREGEDVYGTPEEEQEPVWNIRSLKLRRALRI